MNYAQLLFPDFSLIACGYLLCRYTALDREVWTKVDALVYYFLFPVLLFHAIVRNPLDVQAASSLISAGLLTGLCSIALAYSLPYWPWVGRRFTQREHAASAQVAFRFNSYIGLALAERMSGAPGLQMFAVLVGVCVPMFNVAAVWPMARHAQRGVLGELVRNPLIIATLSGLLCNLAGLGMPEFLAPTATRIGSAALALGLMAAGAGLQFSSMKQAKTLAVSVLTIRHLLTPLMAAGMAWWFALDPAQAGTLLTFASVPTASTCYLLAARMGYNSAYVAGLVTLSTLLGMVSLPFALAVLR